MTVRPKVSVIVPVHGTARSLRQCLDSLAGQSLRDIEIIAVDDASPDGAGGIIDEYARRDPRVRSLTNAVRRNLFETRLRGFEAAEGEYIAVCDSDDSMPPQALERLCAAADREGADIVHGRTRALRGDRRQGAVLYNHEPFRVATGGLFVASMVGNIRGWNVWGKLFRRGLVRSRLGAFPRNTGWFQGEDMAFCTVFGLAAERYAGIEDAVYAYRQPGARGAPDGAAREKRGRDQLGVLEFVGEALERAPGGDGLREPFRRMAGHVMAAVLRTVPEAARRGFSEDLARLGIEPARRAELFSPRCHYGWLRRNGMREYGIRLRILWANACGAAGRRVS